MKAECYPATGIIRVSWLLFSLEKMRLFNGTNHTFGALPGILTPPFEAKECAGEFFNRGGCSHTGYCY
jgi:hypothetical protein